MNADSSAVRKDVNLFGQVSSRNVGSARVGKMTNVGPNGDIGTIPAGQAIGRESIQVIVRDRVPNDERFHGNNDKWQYGLRDVWW